MTVTAGAERTLHLHRTLEQEVEANAALRGGYADGQKAVQRVKAAVSRRKSLPSRVVASEQEEIIRTPRIVGDDPLAWATQREGWYKNARANLASSTYGARAHEAQPLDRTFNIRKPQKFERTLPLATSTETEWTVSSWAVGSCAGTSPLNGAGLGVATCVGRCTGSCGASCAARSAYSTDSSLRATSAAAA
jgi:hypothetical protein